MYDTHTYMVIYTIFWDFLLIYAVPEENPQIYNPKI